MAAPAPSASILPGYNYEWDISAKDPHNCGPAEQWTSPYFELGCARNCYIEFSPMVDDACVLILNMPLVWATQIELYVDDSVDGAGVLERANGRYVVRSTFTKKDHYTRVGVRVLSNDCEPTDEQICRKWRAYPQKFLAWHNSKNRTTYDQLQVLILTGAPKPDESTNSVGMRALIGDTSSVYQYFVSNAADVVNCIVNLEPTQSAGNSKREDLLKFLSKPGNNKLLYFSGHGGPGVIKLGGGIEFSWVDLEFSLMNASFVGTLTLVLDSCNSATWLQMCYMEAANKNSAMNMKLGKLMINIHASCQPGEPSYIAKMSSKFTSKWLEQLDSQSPRDDRDSHGFGTRLLCSCAPERLEKIEHGTSVQQPWVGSFLFHPERDHYCKDVGLAWCHHIGIEEDELSPSVALEANMQSFREKYDARHQKACRIAKKMAHKLAQMGARVARWYIRQICLCECLHA